MSDPDDSGRGVVCRNYTSARRFPLVIGNIQGLRLRVPWTPAQLGVAVVSIVVLAGTRPVWAHLGWVGNAVVLVGVPWVLAQLVRRVRIEGRPPWRFALGWLASQSARWSAPATPRPVRLGGRVSVETRPEPRRSAPERPEAGRRTEDAGGGGRRVRGWPASAGRAARGRSRRRGDGGGGVVAGGR